MLWFRVDNRLVHGQVIEGWLPYVAARHLIVANDARMKEVYAAVYTREGSSFKEAMPESVLSPEDAAEKFTALAGDGVKCVLAGSGFGVYAPLQEFPDPFFSHILKNLLIFPCLSPPSTAALLSCILPE